MPESTIQRLCNKAMQIIQVNNAACLSLGIADDSFHMRVISPVNPGKDLSDQGMIPIEDSSSSAMNERKTIVFDEEGQTMNMGDITIDAPFMVAPMIWKRDSIDDEPDVIRPVGVLVLWGPRSGEFTADDERLASMLATQASSLIIEERLVEIEEAAVAISTVPVALVMLDIDGDVALINPTAEELLNGPKPKDRSLADIDRANQIAELVGRAKKSANGRASGSFDTDDGEALSASAQIAKHGECVIALSRTFVGDNATSIIGQVAHELRTPLTVIMGNNVTVQTLMENDDLGESDIAICIEMIEASIGQCHRMTRMIGETLNLSRISVGKSIELKKSEFDVSSTINKLLSEVGGQYASHTIDLQLTPGLVIVADEDKFISVIDNLLKNAWKYSPHGSSITIKTCMHGGNTVSVSVIDQGIGISPKDIDRIGREPGFRTDESRKQAGGIGLGMIYVRKVVETHGGTIHIDSILGKGSTFTATFPVGSMEPSNVIEL